VIALTSDTRIAVLARMIKDAPGLGRTQVMKLCYFLQELKGVPLGYDFRLFNYGPFDSEVLSDLSSGCGLGALVEDTVLYPKGYGYAIKPGPQIEQFAQELDAVDTTLGAHVDQVVREFGGFSASELELRSTILFVDREFASTGSAATANEIAERVRRIKPHFELSVIERRVSDMTDMGQLLTQSLAVAGTS
jgi:uncharacterized protein